VATHPFLSDEWIAAARAIYEEYRGKAQPVPHALKANLVISEVPFGSGSIDAHVDTTDGELVMDTGHLPGADIKLGVDWATAKAILIDQNPQAGLQAFMAGKVKIMEGDLSKLMGMMQTGADPDPVAIEVAKRVQEITAP
jgi:hypothetical protein